MQHLGTDEDLVQAMRDLWTTMSPEERLDVFPVQERLKGLPAEERLKGLSAEERLKGLSAEERLRGLTAEQVEHLRRLLQRPLPGEGDASRSKES